LFMQLNKDKFCRDNSAIIFKINLFGYGSDREIEGISAG
jgi:hypothetical protein